VVAAGAALSRWPDAIIYNSRVAARQHEALGYKQSNGRLIPNGFDTDRFAPDGDARRAVRLELKIPGEAKVVGMIQRWHAMKDHACFLNAAAVLPDRGIRFVLAGRGVDHDNSDLRQLISDRGLDGRVHLLGERRDVDKVCNALDVLCSSSSYGEAFPNIVGEAMACGIPCAVTDIGDSAHVVGTTGIVVPPRDSSAMACAIADLFTRLYEGRTQVRRVTRERIVRHFSLSATVTAYEALYADSCPNGTNDISH
jgi:glycosyltransferase involved in cell wall biosynthesis